MIFESSQKCHKDRQHCNEAKHNIVNLLTAICYKNIAQNK